MDKDQDSGAPAARPSTDSEEAAFQRGWMEGATARDPETDPALLAMRRRHTERWWKASHAERIADMAEYAEAKAAAFNSESGRSVAATMRAAADAFAAAREVDAALLRLWELLPEGSWEDAPYSSLALAGHALHTALGCCTADRKGTAPKGATK